ncbi:MAG: CDGSH iron-sulfur domain-containing protein [Longimicrobiales bacterium]|nr:CDGSH iron-sulfur domain-containing protein [Longimicrobiales bacterium]
MADQEFRITISENGSYKVEGGPRLVDADGNPIETREGRPFFLCRCGHSQNKPFCDGAHNREEWDPTLASS